MRLSEFISALPGNGRVIFETVTLTVGPEDEADAVLELERLDQRRRIEMAFEAPAMNLEPAYWSMLRMYQAAQLSVFRDVPEDDVRAALQVPCPGAAGAVRSYSTDLGLRWLPKLHQQAKRLSPNDPLTSCLEQLAVSFPLSSIGMSLGQELPPDELDFVWENPSLRTLYVERVIDTKDAARLRDSRVRLAVTDAVANRKELCDWLRDCEERL